MRSAALLCALCIATSAGAVAAADIKEHWFVAKASDGSLAYDAETLKRDPKSGVLTFSTILYLTAPDKSLAGVTYQYILSQDRLNCAAHTFQAAARILLDGDQNIVDEIPLDTQPWKPISENAALTFFESVACNGEGIADTREADRIEDALTLMKTMAN